MNKMIAAVSTAVLLAACSTAQKQEQAMEQTTAPINCNYAEGDLRALNAEKANTAERIAEGVTSITPVGVLAGLVEGTEDTKYQVATGDYNKALDKRIAEIKSTCGVQ